MSLPATTAVQGILRLLRFEPAMFAAFEVWDRESKSVVGGCEAVAIQGSRLVVLFASVVLGQIVWSNMQAKHEAAKPAQSESTDTRLGQ